jgi:hypothetical protein
MSLILIKNACRKILPDSSWENTNTGKDKDKDKDSIFKISNLKVKEDGSRVANVYTYDGSQVCFLLKGCRIIHQSSQSLLVETSSQSLLFLKKFWKTIFPMISYSMKVSKILNDDDLDSKFSEIYIWISRKEFSGKIYEIDSVISCFVELHGLWKKSSSTESDEIGINLQAKMITITSSSTSRKCMIEDDDE